MRAAGNTPAEAGPGASLTLRSLVLGIALAYVSVLWVREVEIVRLRCQISEAVPPIPAVAALLLLIALSALGRRMGWSALIPRAGEALVVYVFVAVACVMSSVGVVRMLLPSLTVPAYFADPGNQFAQFAQNLPPWYAPRGEAVVQGFFEGAEGTPWRVWTGPLLTWMAFGCAYFVGSFTLLGLLRPHWSERERLAFPLSDFPIRLLGDTRAGGAALRARDPWLWIGIGAASLHNLLNMLHAFNPNVPALGTFYPIGQHVFTERPLDALAGLSVWYRPAILGLAYFVPTNILGSSALFFVLSQVSAVWARATGTDAIGAPFLSEQAIGCYLVLGVVALWGARGRLMGADGTGRASLLVIGLCASLLVGIVTRAGLPLPLALVYLGMGLLVMVAYARVRAETGAPNAWLFPFQAQRSLIINAVGSEALRGGANYEGATIFAQLFFLDRGYFVSVPALHIEGLESADRAGARPGEIAWSAYLAVPVGLALAFWLHLTTYYNLGANVLEGGSSEGGVRTLLARQHYQALSDCIAAPTLPDRTRLMASLVGVLATVAIIIARRTMVRCPIHPVGFALPSALGQVLWAPFGLAWLLKAAFLHIGGIGLYRRMQPAFLGLVLGHYFTAGIVWGIISMLGGEATEAYQVWFG